MFPEFCLKLHMDAHTPQIQHGKLPPPEISESTPGSVATARVEKPLMLTYHT